MCNESERTKMKLTHQDLSRHIGKFYGKYSGEVTNNEDDEKRGQIKVKVPSVFGLNMEVTARPCFATAHFYVPPVGAKVWVEFEAGDPNYPLYVGVWYPVDAAPPEAAINPPDNRVIQTPSGHTIEMMDKEGEEKIVIRHKDNSFIAFDKDGNVVISNKNGSHVYLNAKEQETTITEEHGNFIRMKDDGITVVNVNGALIEMKEDKVKVVAKEAVTINAKDVNIESSTVSLGKGAGLAGQSAILGEIFMTLYSTHTHACAVGPTGPPLPPVQPLLNTPLSPLSKAVKLKLNV
jgi:hypothetical protein